MSRRHSFRQFRRSPPRGGLILPEDLAVTKVALGYPYGGGVTGPFLESLLRLQLYELSKPQPLLWHRLPQSGLYVAHNRQRIAEKFMAETQADWLLQIDSDIEFPHTIVEALLAAAGSEKKIVAASVPLGVPYPSCGWMDTPVPGIWACVPSEKVPIGPEALKVDAIASAVLLVHREVLASIADREGQCWFIETMVPKMNLPPSAAAWSEGGAIRDRQYIPIGEDLAFSMRARDAGHQCWVTRIPGLKHYKTLPMSHDYEVEEAPPAFAGALPPRPIVPWNGGNGGEAA